MRFPFRIVVFVFASVVVLGGAGSASAQPLKNRISILVDSSKSMLQTPQIVTFPETCVANNWNGCTSSGNPSTAQEQCNACMAWTVRNTLGCSNNFTVTCRNAYGDCWRFFNSAPAPACNQVLGVSQHVTTRGDGSSMTPGCDVSGDGQPNDSRMYQAKEALQEMVATSGEVELALWRYAQVEGGQTCSSDGECPDTPAGQSHLTCESVGGTNRCALDASTLGSAAGQCSPFAWNGSDMSFSCAQCSDAGVERLLCEGFGLGQIRTGGTSPLTGTVNCALPTSNHPFLMSHGAFVFAGACDPTGAERLVDFPATGFDDNHPAIFAWIDHVQPNLATDVEIIADGGSPIAASLRDMRTAVFDSARLDTRTPCRTNRVILIADGAENCESNAAAVTAAGTFQNMSFTNARGVTVPDYDVPVYVIGFGACLNLQNCQAGQDLNAIAAAGGTGSAILVDSQLELQAALEQIVADAGTPETEACNGLDDTCDGVVDESPPPPGEIDGLVLGPDKLTLSWSAPTPPDETVYDLVKGELNELPVGSGPSEACFTSGTAGVTTTDGATPGQGTGFWYLVRGRRVCSAGSYGTGAAGAERITAACP